MNEPKMTLKECIEQLEWCNYECEAGKLKCNIAFRQLKTVVDRIEFAFEKHQRDKKLIEKIALSDSIAIETGGNMIKYILTGCSDDEVSEIELKKMGYE